MAQTVSQKKELTPSAFIAPLFYKILGAILIPLIVLLLTLSFMIIRREVLVEMDRCVKKTEVVLKSIQEEFIKIFVDSELSPRRQPKEALALQADFLRKMFTLEKIDIVDPTTLVSLLDGSTPENSTDPAVLEAFEGVPESMVAKRKGEDTYMQSDIKWNSKSQAVFGYIPFKHNRDKLPLVLVTVLSTSFKEMMVKTMSQVAFMFVVTLLVGMLIAIRLSHRIIRPINEINHACREILNGKLGLQVKVQTGDEIETMAKNFNQMSRALMIMQRQAKDSNPLTNLPGNQWIMEELKHRIKSNQKFVFFHIDIDRFKAYNDYYGLAKGDNVLRRTGEILRMALKEAGSKNNFVGHQGGDDFVLILDFLQAELIAKNVCKKFDEALKEFYDEEILKQGYFIGEESRPDALEESKIKRHQVMAISLAGISNQSAGNTISPEDILQAAISVKKRAKKIPYSKFLIEEIRPV